jgi:hypothetical protein
VFRVLAAHRDLSGDLVRAGIDDSTWSFSSIAAAIQRPSGEVDRLRQSPNATRNLRAARGPRR